jgi:hypothetical protein
MKERSKYKPKATNTYQEKTIWTERRLQDCKNNLFKLFKKCHNDCTKCEARECDKIVSEMDKYLVPYGESIFKRAFKRRATCEEMERVVTESVNALLMDVWGKKKDIHTSFGAMLKWKMIYYLDGNVNLFDTVITEVERDSKTKEPIVDPKTNKPKVKKTKRIQSIDSMTSKFTNASHDDNGADVIQYYSDTFENLSFDVGTYSEVYKKETIEVIKDLVRSFIDNISKVMPYKERCSIYIKVVYLFNRFMKGYRNPFRLSDSDRREALSNSYGDIHFYLSKNKKVNYYYGKLLEAIRKYLKEYSVLN